MQAYRAGRRIGSTAGAILATLLYGCAASPDSPHTDAGEPTPPPGGEPISTVVDARPAALVGGRTIPWGELRPILNEAAGATALQEVILDRRLAELTADAGRTITDDDAAAEQRMLLQTLNDDPSVALRLLDELRARQNLGPHRFRSLLRRNAMLRALVRDRVRINPATVQQMYDAKHGPKRQVRLLTTGDLSVAQSAIDFVNAGEHFGDLVVQLSTDASAPRGGLLEPVSRSDPAYPAALRQAIWNLDGVGAMSDAILLDNGYAVAQLVREVEGDGVTLEEAREDLERLVRMNQERLLMDELARRILTDVSVTVFDQSLNESWKRFERQLRRNQAQPEP